jgi:alcohol dehydrogenase
MNMRSFQHLSSALRVFHGADSLKSLSSELERLKCRRAMIVCGASMARAGTLIDLIRSALGERCAGVYAGVRAHSPLPAVESAAQALKQHDADSVIAVGGGSAMVTARAASILIAESGDARSLCTTRDANGEIKSPRLLAPKLPQLAIPTTPTTAVAKAGSAVFDPVAKLRLALFDPKTRAQAIFIHPELVMSSPRELVVSAGLNTLVMAIEGLMSRSGSPISDALLMHALRLLALHLPSPAVAEDAAVRGELLLAALLCGQGTTPSAGVMAWRTELPMRLFCPARCASMPAPRRPGCRRSRYRWGWGR